MADTVALRLAAASGDTRAQLDLAQMMLAGRETGYAPEHALKLVEAACERGSTDAMLFHATLAALGVARARSFDDAIELLTVAAERGDARAKGQLAALGGRVDPSVWFAPVQLVQRHAAPRIFTIENLIPKAACDWLMQFAAPKREAAPVRDPEKGLILDPARSNTVAATRTLESDLVLQLARLRIAGAIQTPMTQQEPANVLHYAPGQEYRPHYDFVAPGEESAFAAEFERVGQRVATVLVYLNDGYDGGETAFPRLGWSYKGKPGDALVFWNISTAGECERDSLHAGAPVTRGEKWLLSVWVRERPVPLI